jgi:hypothetical protein
MAVFRVNMVKGRPEAPCSLFCQSVVSHLCRFPLYVLYTGDVVLLFDALVYACFNVYERFP